ncbi:MAG TPA: hypothetical protein VEU47_05315 [Candidatus Cybelea sp.]|nr:hypothetical protein [Candidatus Cybelea sp.]
MGMARYLLAGLAIGLILWTADAVGQAKPDCDASGRVKTPEMIEGQVTKMDAATGLVTIQEANGTVHQFQASKEMLQNAKVGDRVKGKLREAPKCP